MTTEDVGGPPGGLDPQRGRKKKSERGCRLASSVGQLRWKFHLGLRREQRGGGAGGEAGAGGRGGGPDHVSEGGPKEKRESGSVRQEVCAGLPGQSSLDMEGRVWEGP